MAHLRYALRSLLSSPGYAAIAVLTLALGIGSATAIFSAVNAVLLRPLPTPELDRVVVMRQDIESLDIRDAELAPPDVEDLAARTDQFQAVGAYTPREWNLTGAGEPVRLGAALTMGDFFTVFRVRPHLGRLYGGENSTSGEHEVVVLSHRLWQQLTGGDPAVVGTTLLLDGLAREVVGVLPPGFEFPRGTQIYKPMDYTPQLREQRGRLIMTPVARLQPGVTPERLAAGLDAQVVRWANEHQGGSTGGRRLFAVPLVEHISGPLRTVLLMLMAAVGMVLLITCANVASLQFVRASARAREMAVRTAVGAGRGDIVRQLLVESLLLAAAGGVLGLLLGRAALGSLAHWDPLQRMSLEGVPLDGTVLAFTAAVSLLCAVAFGVVPAVRAARVEPQHVLREAGGGASAGRARVRLLHVSAVVQVAIALPLLVGSGLMIRSLDRLLSADLGFQPESVVAAQVSLPFAQYDDVPAQAAFYDALLERLEAAPGVEAAAVGWALPFSNQIRDSSPFSLPRRPAAADGPERHAEYRVVSGSYFRTMGIPLLRGRTFDDADHADAPVVVLVDEHFANQFFPGEDPVGQPIGHARGDATIVGVVGSVQHGEIGEPAKALTYYHYRQTWSGTMAIAVRGPLDPGAAATLMRTAVTEIDPNLPLYDVAAMTQRVRHSLGAQRLAVGSLAAFGAGALLLAVLGVYGLMRFSIGQRTREIGIRMALGARRASVVRMVVVQGMRIALAGIGLGLAGTLVLSRLMSGMLYEVGEWDPVTLAVVAAILLSTALAAAYLPARRAARIDPMRTLRAE